MNEYNIQFVSSSMDLIDMEVEIVNSNKEYNVLAKDKPVLSKEEVLQEIDEAYEVGAERFVIKEDNSFIGISEILMLNPKDGYPWIGLLMIKKDLHHKGYGTDVVREILAMLKAREVSAVRLGVLIDNEQGHRFWTKQGFHAIAKKISNEHKEVIVYEKEI
ncbi:Acetyltransferase (GNAT) family protein [compost metagenome]